MRNNILSIIAIVSCITASAQDVCVINGNISDCQLADGKKVKKLYTVPEKQEISFKEEDGYITFTVPDFAGHTMIVAEE